MKYLVTLIFMLVILSSQALQAEATFTTKNHQGLRTLSAESWARPRSGASVAMMPAVRAAVQDLLSAPAASKLVIRYPGGEEGSLWAEELHVWLISLGVDAALMELRPGSSESDQIELYIE